MKIGIHDPYLDSLGGGERYILTLAEFLSAQNEVDLFWDGEEMKRLTEQRLCLDLNKVKIVNNIFTREKKLLQKLIETSRYDLIIALSDGSIPAIFSKKGILHFQVPFIHLNGRTLSNQLKLTRFQSVVCNSYFTKRFIDKTYGIKSLVIYPPVDVKNFKPQTKKNLILSVGRFTRSLHTKKQDVLIKAFKELLPKMRGWELILAGGMMAEDRFYIKDLEEMVGGAPIKILPGISFSDLKTLYGQAKIYWHATGFGENEEEHPERMEHFGITTVEAMASGCVPVVFAGGGLTEIIKDQENGRLWQSLDEFKNQTLGLLKDESVWQKISLSAQKRSGDFSQEKFYGAFSEIIYR